MWFNKSKTRIKGTDRQLVDGTLMQLRSLEIHDQDVIFVMCNSNEDYSWDIDRNASGDTLILSDDDQSSAN